MFIVYYPKENPLNINHDSFKANPLMRLSDKDIFKKLIDLSDAMGGGMVHAHNTRRVASMRKYERMINQGMYDGTGYGVKGGYWACEVLPNLTAKDVKELGKNPNVFVV